MSRWQTALATSSGSGSHALQASDGLHDIALVPGQINMAAVCAYTEYGCWLLALCLHEMTGWPIVALSGHDLKNSDDVRNYWEHMAVRMPNRRLLDITGARDESDMRCSWQSAADGLWDGVETALLNEANMGSGCRPSHRQMNKALTRTFCRTLLDQLAVESSVA